MQQNEQLDSDFIKQNLNNRLIGREILFFNSVTSTNDVAKKFASQYSGAVVVAEKQTKGKGRQNRTWISPPNTGLWFSVILHPKCSPENLGLLSLLASNAIRKAINSLLGVNPQLKWPNDVFLNGKKISGILLESLFQGYNLNYVIIGIGINVNQTRKNFPSEINTIASSLFIETKEKITREALFLKVLHELELDYLKFQDEKFEKIISEWSENCMHKGKKIALSTAEEKFVSGIFQGVDVSGKLCVLTPEQKHVIFSSAEVRII